MIILTLRTDKPEAEVGLYRDDKRVAYETWEAHRQLAETLHKRISSLLEAQDMTLQEVDAIACYQGPGSFTGLRIGLSVSNALSYALDVPVAGAMGEEWLHTAIGALQAGKGQKAVMPEYGSPINITPPRQ
jgi:tRNA threonylcarbamoyladenosine biosynthesis protein TsaB